MIPLLIELFNLQSMSPYPGSIDGPRSVVGSEALGSTSNQPTSSYSGVNQHVPPVTGVGLRKPNLPDAEYKSADGSIDLKSVYESSKLQAW